MVDNKAKTEMHFSMDCSDNAGRRGQKDTPYVVWYEIKSPEREEKKNEWTLDLNWLKDNDCMDVDENELTTNVNCQAFVEVCAHFVTYKWVCRFS